MGTKRLFIGTYINSDLFLDKYEEIQLKFKVCCTGKWVEPVNMHFTYLFLGDVDENIIPEIKKSLNNFLIEYNSKIIIKGISVLPKLSFPRILFVKIINNDLLLLKLQKQMEKIMTEYDYQPENREYLPHVTLLRIKEFDRHKFAGTVESFKSYDFGEMEKFKISLIESKLTKEGPIYSII
ncbi:MAG: RNA 2',3'-cyclic phosphodiesterase [Ignavibacteriae bacterium]|nr:RNA 2',3'-cyclic phosphodiesterase [Ignavibacteriota bacterium]